MSLHPLKDVVSRQVARIVINDITFIHILYRLAKKKAPLHGQDGKQMVLVLELLETFRLPICMLDFVQAAYPKKA